MDQRTIRDAHVVRALDAWAVGPGPVYVRLANALREAIERSDLAPGTRLPAERSLARALALSRGTVIASFDLLRREGLLERRRGSGTWVSRGRVGSRLLSSAGATGLDGRPVLRSLTETHVNTIEFLGAHLPGEDIPWEDVLKETAEELAVASASHGYTPAGLLSLRSRLADDLRRSGLPTTAEQVLITSGAQQAISLVGTLYVRPGETVVLENPTYPGAIDTFLAARARLASVPVQGDGVCVDALRATVAKVRPSLIYLIPTSHNPTGMVMPARQRADVVRVAEEHDVPVLEDSTLEGLCLEPPSPPSLASFPGSASVITVGSFGKLFWGGLRVGWIRAPARVISTLSGLKAASDLGTSIPSQLIALSLLPRASDMRALRRAQIGAHLDLLDRLMHDALPTWSWTRPAGGLSLWVRLPKGRASEFAQVAMRNGVAVAPGPLASPNNTCEDRIRLGFMREPAVLEEGIERLAQAWLEYTESPRLRAVTPRAIV